MTQRTRQRRRQRGAALVEAAVAIPFFIVVFVALAFVGRLYVEKQRTLSLARQQAWVYAMQYCEGSSSGASSESTGALPSDVETDSGSENIDLGSSDGGKSVNDFGGVKGSEKATKDGRMATSLVQGKTVTANTKETKQGSQSTILNFEQKVRTTAWVTCNEKPEEGTLSGFISKAYGLLTGG